MIATATIPLLAVLIGNSLLLTTTAAFIDIHPTVRECCRYTTRPHSVIIRHETTSSLSSSSSSGNECPFVGIFPRFKINLTYSKSKKQKGFFLFQKKIPLVGDMIQGAIQKAMLEQRYGTMMNVLSGQSGVRAFSSLWMAVEELVHDTTTTTTSRVLVLPDCDNRILVNWVEMMEWIDDMEGLVDVRIQAKVLEDHVVMIERLSGPPQQIRSTSTFHDADTIERRTKAWVQRLLVEMGICPFTKSMTKSGQGLGDLGVPVGSIAYHTSQSQDIYHLMADTWKAISDMLEAGPSGKDGISSILLAAPEFDQALDVWCGPVFCLLETGVVAAQAESQIGVVCFHPEYKTPDGSTFPGFGHMHSLPRLERWVKEVKQGECPFSPNDLAAGGAWQRRTPHATINVLRADQLEAAETRRQTPNLYTRNIETLLAVGSKQLEEDLNREKRLL